MSNNTGIRTLKSTTNANANEAQQWNQVNFESLPAINILLYMRGISKLEVTRLVNYHQRTAY